MSDLAAKLVNEWAVDRLTQPTPAEHDLARWILELLNPDDNAHQRLERALHRCCDLHTLGPAGRCCDPDDCGPCCENCPTCPTLYQQKIDQEWKPTVIPIWQDSPVAKWLVPVSADADLNNPWSGWLDVNTEPRCVEIAGCELTPDEARLAARALMAAADHVEQFTHRTCGALFDLISPGGWPELNDKPREFQVAARDHVRAAIDRIRTRGGHA